MNFRGVLLTVARLRLAWVMLCVAVTWIPAVGQQARSPEPQPLFPILRPALPDGPRKIGFVDAAGRNIVPPQYDKVGTFNDGRAQVRIANKTGYIDQHGKLVVPAIYDFAGEYSEGLAAVSSQVGVDRQWRVIDRDGREIVLPGYGRIGNIQDGMIVVGSKAQPMRMGAIDTTGQPVIDLKYESITAFSEGLAAAKITGKVGYISKTGELVVPAIYQYAQPFVGGRAIVTIKEGKTPARVGVIDRDGKYVVEPVHNAINAFRNGMAVASDYLPINGETLHLVSQNGARLRTGIGSDTLCGRDPYRSWIPEDLTVHRIGDRCFFADDAGKNRFGRDFAKALPFADGFALAAVSAAEAFGTETKSKRLFWGVIQANGVFVVPPMFDGAEVAGPNMIKITFAGQVEYFDGAGHPLTFDEADLDAYKAKMRAYFSPIARSCSHDYNASGQS